MITPAIVQKENKILRQKAVEVPLAEIPSPKIQKILKEMKAALAAQEDGVAIAAPQIGASLRIFVLSLRAFTPVSKKTEAKEIKDQRSGIKDEKLIFINPKIVKLSKKKMWLPEGCLSCRWLYGEIERSSNATVESYDEKGKKFTRGAGGLLAQIFKHETDHLNGVLFIDKARNLREIPPEKKQQGRRGQ